MSFGINGSWRSIIFWKFATDDTMKTVPVIDDERTALFVTKNKIAINRATGIELRNKSRGFVSIAMASFENSFGAIRIVTTEITMNERIIIIVEIGIFIRSLFVFINSVKPFIAASKMRF